MAKFRTGFVSNSSSSSFVLFNPTHLDLEKVKEDGCKGYILLTGYNREKVLRDLGFDVKAKGNIYLTGYISDSLDFNEDSLDCEHFEYQYGGHGEPYSERGLNKLEVDNGYGYVYILKEEIDDWGKNAN